MDLRCQKGTQERCAPHWAHRERANSAALFGLPLCIKHKQIDDQFDYVCCHRNESGSHNIITPAVAGAWGHRALIDGSEGSTRAGHGATIHIWNRALKEAAIPPTKKLGVVPLTIDAEANVHHLVWPSEQWIEKLDEEDLIQRTSTAMNRANAGRSPRR